MLFLVCFLFLLYYLFSNCVLIDFSFLSFLLACLFFFLFLSISLFLFVSFHFVFIICLGFSFTAFFFCVCYCCHCCLFLFLLSVLGFVSLFFFFFSPFFLLLQAAWFVSSWFPGLGIWCESTKSRILDCQRLPRPKEYHLVCTLPEVFILTPRSGSTQLPTGSSGQLRPKNPA